MSKIETVTVGNITYDIGGGHTMLDNSTIINGIATASADNTDDNVVSAYGVGNWSNTITSRYIYEDISSGDNCIGTWYDGDLSSITSSDETDWWQNDGFKNLLADDNFEISIKFDPSAADEEVLICTGYILDDTTGKICIRFGSAVTKSTHRVAVDITRTRTNVSIES